MDKNKMMEMFEQVRENAGEYVLKDLMDLPAGAGTYSISIEGVKSIKPITLNFDGENWNEKELSDALKDAGGDITKISYYDKKLVKTIKNKM